MDSGTSNNIIITPNFSKFTSEIPMEQENEKITITNSSMQTYSKIDANSRGICEICERKNIDITQGITKSLIIHYCKNCNRYLKPPWIKCNKESEEMMNLCLSKIKGLNKIKVIDSSFIWTEPHSKIIKIKLSIQKEINKILLSTSFINFSINFFYC